MPRGDGTGPIGYGPGTGRGAGYCIGSFEPGYMRKPCFGYGRAFVKRFGRRYGFHQMFHGAGSVGFANNAVNSEAAEIKLLQRQAAILEKRLQQVNQRLSSLKQDA
jgi:hypothetical protein